LLAHNYWLEIPNHFPFVELGNFVVMPNHMHGILIINKNNGPKTDGKTVETLHCNVSNNNPARDNYSKFSNLENSESENPNSQNTESENFNSQNTESENPNSQNTESENLNSQNNNMGIDNIETNELIFDITETLQCNVSSDEHNHPPSPTNQFMSSISPKPGSISTIIRSYKSIVSKNARLIKTNFEWQSRFHDIIIRDAQSFQNIQNYIVNNPMKWAEDKFRHA
jgi:putative transposase